MNGKLNHKEIYNLFKTNSSKINKKIYDKIDIFKHNMSFFEYYASKDIKNLFNIFELNLSKNNDEPFSFFESDIEQYISCISHIILSIKLFLKTQDILKKMFISSKNHLSKLKYKNKLENINKDYLFLYLDSLLKSSEKNHKINSSTSTLLSDNITSFDAIPKYSKFKKLSSDYLTDVFSNCGIESNKYDNYSTPKFKSDEKFENQEKKYSNFENSIENNLLVKNDSILILSEFIFAEEPSTPKNLESKFIEPRIIKPKIKNTFTYERISKTKNIGKIKKIKHKRYKFSEADLIIKNDKKNHCINLLEMINKIYKKGLINSEEKVKLKQLVIDKSKKIEYLYYNIYKNSKNVKNTLVTEVKKIVN